MPSDLLGMWPKGQGSVKDGCDLIQHLFSLLNQPLCFLENGSGMLGQRNNMLPLRSKETHWALGLLHGGRRDQVEQSIAPLEGIYEHGPDQRAPRNCTECSWHFTSCRARLGDGPNWAALLLVSPASRTCLPVAADSQLGLHLYWVSHLQGSQRRFPQMVVWGP